MKSEQQPKMTRMLPYQEKQSQVTRVSCLLAAPLSSSFEDTQAFLQKAAAQLKVEDHAKEALRDQVAAIVEQIISDHFEKSVIYDLPIDEEMKVRFEFMNAKQLAAMEFKLSLGPEGIATRYIRWMHESLGTDEPNPLAGWLERLDADIKMRYPFASHRVYRGAERQVYALVGMYISALQGWIAEFSAALSLDVLVTACIKCSQRLSPELSMRLTEEQHSLSICAAVMKSIEDNHLRESVMPDTLCSALEPNQLKSRTITHSLDRSVKLAAEASSRVTTLLATAVATANLHHCHELFLSLTQATMTLGNRRRDHELSMHFLDQASAKPRQPKKHLVARANHYARPTRGIKPRQPTKKTTSTTRVKKAKAHIINGMDR